MTDSFPAGGNLAMQLINNETTERIVPISIDYLQAINNYTLMLLNNDYDLENNDSLVMIDGVNVTITIPSKSLVVLALDAVWSYVQVVKAHADWLFLTTRIIQY